MGTESRGATSGGPEALGDHIDLVYGLGVVPDSRRGSELCAVRVRHACALGVKNLLVGSGKGYARGGPGQRDDSKVLSFRTDHLNAGGSRGDVKTALRVYGHAVA